MSDQPRSDDYSSLTRILGTSFLTLAVGLLVIGTFLLTTCQTETVVGPFSTTVGCDYPFQDYGLALLYLGALVTILSANLFARSLQPHRPSREALRTHYALSIFAFFMATVLLLIAVWALKVG
jgi:hypothetical protein